MPSTRARQTGRIVAVDSAWESHREIRLLLVPVSPISSSSFERCKNDITHICSGPISLNSLGGPNLLRDCKHTGDGDSAFENLSWESGSVSFVVLHANSLHECEPDACPWVDQPHRHSSELGISHTGAHHDILGRVRAVIGLQAYTADKNKFKAEELAIDFATSKHNADPARIASTGVYVDVDCAPFCLQRGTLQPAT